VVVKPPCAGLESLKAVPQVLIIRPGAIGDFIVSLPALEHLRAPYTEVWTSEANLPLVLFADAKQSIISAGLDRVGIMASDDVLQRLRRFDSIVSWYGANRPEFRELVADAGLPFEFHRALPPAGAGVHAVDYYCAQIGAPQGSVPRIEVGPVGLHDAVVLHPFASNAQKRWPRSPDFRLDGVEVVRIRGPEEHLPGALYIPDLLDLARFLAGARAYIGNDSGITHLAAAVGVPTIALFGTTDPAIWGPRGKNVRIIHAAKMADISPDVVVDALRDLGIY
jgi:heptosyltransferase-3